MLKKPPSEYVKSNVWLTTQAHRGAGDPTVTSMTCWNGSAHDRLMFSTSTIRTGIFDHPGGIRLQGADRPPAYKAGG